LKSKRKANDTEGAPRPWPFEGQIFRPKTVKKSSCTDRETINRRRRGAPVKNETKNGEKNVVWEEEKRTRNLPLEGKTSSTEGKHSVPKKGQESSGQNQNGTT